jgi:hypothetical protein
MKSDLEDETYLSEVIRGGYRENTEERFSQLFKATYNHSNSFQKLTNKLFGLRNRNKIVCESEIRFGHDRLDLVFYSKATPVLIIENKIESTLTVSQLNRYSNNRLIPNVKKIAITKNLPLIEMPKTWKYLNWSDIYHSLLKQISNKNNIEAFLLGLLAKKMEDLEMTTVKTISKREFIGLADAMHQIKDQPFPQISLSRNAFTSVIDKYIGFLHEIYVQAMKQSWSKKLVNKRFTPWIGHWWPEEKKKKVHLWIGLEFRFKKQIGKINRVGTGIHFYGKQQKYSIEIYTSDKANNYLPNEKVIRSGNLNLDKYVAETISKWTREIQNNLE